MSGGSGFEPLVRARRFRPWLVGLLCASAVLGAAYGPALPALLSRELGAGRPGPATTAVFPSTIAKYSWGTPMLSTSRFEAATMLYQNGAGVEFGDDPQAVLIGTDGSAYRRLDEAESLSIAEDQGDPATTVLSPDGTFAVIGSAGRTGRVEVVTLRDGSRRSVAIGGRRTGLPVAIGADGRTVLLATSDAVVDRYRESSDLGLAGLDIVTGRVRDYPDVDHLVAAALSPDGRQIAALTDRGLALVDVASGRVRATLGSIPHSLDGDAWSPDGNRIVLAQGRTLTVVDVSGDRLTVTSRRQLNSVEYAAAIGWRDDTTALVHGTTNGDENTSELVWVDVTTGREEPFSSYRPNFTGAALYGADAARDLVPLWRIEDRPVDRGPLEIGLPAGPAVVAVLVGLTAALVTRRLDRRRAAG